MNRRDFIRAAAATAAVGALSSRPLAAEDFQKADGMNYAPKGKPNPVVGAGDFNFAAVRLDHGHIYGMCNGLTEAGATVKWVYDPDPRKTDAFLKKYPQAKVARSMDEVLSDPEVKLVAAAAITNERGPLGCTVMEAGKDYFSDKAPFTTLAQLEQSRAVVARTGRKHMVYYAERIHNESAMFATDLVESGAIGKVVSLTILAPHRLAKATRPEWFFKKEQYGGILCDLGSHQFEQVLTYTGSSDAKVTYAVAGNYANHETPELEDLGEACLTGDSGALSYVRVDWFTPDGLPAFGDGRTFIVGTKGTIELRKYVDVAREKQGDQVYIVDGNGMQHINVTGKVGFRFFGQLIEDCIHRTESAMTQAHAFKAAEISLKAQEMANHQA
ncbi:MAG TPA: Gfo/Idh/MocA family oxidoreductase [Opitutaceae bacterium]|jgi:predicted dehydrogenase|nr:Gfo/Idh/MocA family oxidoreductase [Opitutaceae bacterium]